MEEQEMGTAVIPNRPAKSLADRLRATLPIAPGQVMRISPVGKTCFRVNWYSPIGRADDGILTNYRISRSAFFAVREVGDELEIVDRTVGQPSLN